MLEEKREIAGSSWILAYDSFEPEEEGLREVLSLWQCNYVVVRRDYVPNMLRAEADCQQNSGYRIKKSTVVEN